MSERDGDASPSHRLSRIVYDARSRHSTAAAREAARLGVTVVHTDGDITEFWFNDLARIWKGSPAAIAGLTAHGPLFCLERLGWDHGLRVVFRGMHRFHDGEVEHVLTGPVATIATVHGALAADEWPLEIARLLSSCALTPDTTSTTVRTARRDRDSDIDDTLFSWVIAKRGRR